MSQRPHRAAWPSVLDQAGQQLEEEEEEKEDEERGRERRKREVQHLWLDTAREREETINEAGRLIEPPSLDK